MTNNPTIDGVPRELIAEAALTLRLAGGNDGLAEDLRDPLDAPAVERQDPVARCRQSPVRKYLSVELLRTHMKDGDLLYSAPPEVAALQSTIAQLQARIAELESGFFQEVLDEDLKKISDFVGDGDLPKRSFFLRPDAADLANMTMHMVRNVQSLRLKVAELESGGKHV